MFNFFKKNSNNVITDKEENNDDSISIGVGFSATNSATASTKAAAKKFAKPSKYDRRLLDDGVAKKNIKTNAFKDNVKVKDPYTGDILTLTKSEARMKYGDNWAKHLAEADHKISLEKRYEQTKNNPWLTNDDVKASSNSSENLEVVSRKFNNAKRSKSNKDFVSDDEYLKKTGVKLSDQGKEKAIESEKKAQKAMRKQDIKVSAKNVLQTGHNAGMAAAKDSGITGLTMSGIMNLTAVIKGEKTAEDAIADTIVDTGKAAVTGYVMGNGLTTMSHTLSASSSTFLKALSASNVPGKVITSVMVTGDTLKKYCSGEISTQECILELGEKGLNFATIGYSCTVGQALIPIPIVGAAVGAFVGSIITSNYFSQLTSMLKTNKLESEERQRIIAESKKAEKEIRAFRKELETYLSSYFREYNDCFNAALSTIHTALQYGNPDGIVAGANQITRKLGGKVCYENRTEFENFMLDNSTDIL